MDIQVTQAARLTGQVFAALLAASSFAVAAFAQDRPSELSGYTFEIAPNTPAREVDIIYDTMVRSQAYFERFGITLNQRQRRIFVTKVVSTGNGNTERGGGGSCCTSQSRQNPNGPRLFFDVAHRHWTRGGGRKQRAVAHEYTHGIQSIAGVKLPSVALMSDWMAEGMAEFYAYEITGRRGSASSSQATGDALGWAIDNGAINYSLKNLEPRGGHPHAGGMGHLALVGLVENSPNGRAAPLIYTFTLKSKGRARAFEEAFGITIDAFYQRFETWRTRYLAGQTRQRLWHKL